MSLTLAGNGIVTRTSPFSTRFEKSVASSPLTRKSSASTGRNRGSSACLLYLRLFSSLSNRSLAAAGESWKLSDGMWQSAHARPFPPRPCNRLSKNARKPRTTASHGFLPHSNRLPASLPGCGLGEPSAEPLALMAKVVSGTMQATISMSRTFMGVLLSATRGKQAVGGRTATSDLCGHRRPLLVGTITLAEDSAGVLEGPSRPLLSVSQSRPTVGWPDDAGCFAGHHRTLARLEPGR
jgi:hypothetical protein